MNRLMTTLWVTQCLLFVALAAVSLLIPETWHDLFHTVRLEDLHRIPALAGEMHVTVAAMRLSAPLALAMAAFSAHAAMREDLLARRRLARLFALILGAWAASLFTKTFPTRLSDLYLLHSVGERLLFWVVASFAAASAVYGFSPMYRRQERALSGMANTRPPQLWLLWVFQSLLLVGLAVAIYLGGNRLRGFLLIPPSHNPAHTFVKYLGNHHPALAFAGVQHRDLGRDEMESLVPHFLGVGLFGLYALSASREWVWRFLCWIYATTFLATLLVLLFVWDVQSFRPWLFPVVMVPIVGLWYGNRTFARAQAEYFTSDVGQGPDGWTPTDLAGGPILALRTMIIGGKRSFHTTGVGARGYFEVLSRTAYDAFKARDAEPASAHRGCPGDGGPHAFPHCISLPLGQRFPLLVRFSTATQDDDAGMDVRGVALRFSDGPESPLDLCLSTGSYSLTENMIQFLRVLALRVFGRRGQRRLVRQDLASREGVVAGYRRAPECFTRLRYYSQVVRFWVDSDDVRYLVRYRLVPEDLKLPESGVVAVDDDLDNPARSSAERRAPDYLRRELKRRLESPGHPVHLRLQGQFHRPVPGDGLQWYNPGVDWHTGDHPWRDIGTVVLEATLPDVETERLSFDPANHPSSLGVPSAVGAWDYRSMADSEQRVVGRIQSLRRWMHSIIGVPSSPPRVRD